MYEAIKKIYVGGPFMNHKSSTTKHGSLNNIQYDLDHIIIQALHSISRNLPVISQFSAENNSIDPLLMDIITKEVRNQKSIRNFNSKQEKSVLNLNQDRIEHVNPKQLSHGSEKTPANSISMRTIPSLNSLTNLTSTNRNKNRTFVINSSTQAALNRNANYSPPSKREYIGKLDSSKNKPMVLNQATKIHSPNNKLEAKTPSISSDSRIKERSSLKIKIMNQQKDPEMFSFLHHNGNQQSRDNNSQFQSIMNILLKKTEDDALAKHLLNHKSAQRLLTQARGISFLEDKYDIKTIINMENKLKSVLANLAKKKSLK